MGRKSGFRMIRVKNTGKSSNRGAFGQSSGQLVWNKKRRSFLKRFGIFLKKKGRANYSWLWRLLFGGKRAKNDKIIFSR